MSIRDDLPKTASGVKVTQRIKAVDALAQRDSTDAPVPSLKEYVITNAYEFREHLGGPPRQKAARWRELLDAIKGELGQPVNPRTVATYLSSAAARKAAARSASGSGSGAGGAGPSVSISSPTTDVCEGNPFKGQR